MKRLSGSSARGTWTGAVRLVLRPRNILATRGSGLQVVFVFFLFIANFVILFGPLLLMNLTQIKAFEPGDAQWGVKLEDVRGQAEAKEEVRRVVSLWQSGEQFERAGGKRERGVLFLGPPGTGKTMLAKAIATGFNSPFVSIPGSGFAATFIGIDAIVVRYLALEGEAGRAQVGRPVHRLHRRDRRRRHAPADARPGRRLRRRTPLRPPNPSTTCSSSALGGARNPSGDLVLETRAWRDRLFAEREDAARSA